MDHKYFSALVDSLQSVQRPELYATGGVYSMPLPALTLRCAPDNILALPLVSCQANLIAAASVCGKDETSVNSSPHIWQLSPSQFSISNSLKWSEHVRSLVDKVKVELGCGSRARVTYELQGLHLYEPGGSLCMTLVIRR